MIHKQGLHGPIYFKMVFRLCLGFNIIFPSITNNNQNNQNNK